MGRSARSYVQPGPVEVGLHQPRYLSIHSAYEPPHHHHHRRSNQYYPSSVSSHSVRSSGSGGFNSYSGSSYSGSSSRASTVSTLIVNSSIPASSYHRKQHHPSGSMYYASSSNMSSPLSISLPPICVPASPSSSSVMTVPAVGRESRRYYPASTTYHMGGYHSGVPAVSVMGPVSSFSPEYARSRYQPNSLSASSSRTTSQTSLFSHSSAHSSVSSFTPSIEYDSNPNILSVEPSPEMQTQLDGCAPTFSHNHSLPAIINYPSHTIPSSVSSHSTIGTLNRSTSRKRSGSFLEKAVPYGAEGRGITASQYSSNGYHSESPNDPSPNTLSRYISVEKGPTPPSSTSPVGHHGHQYIRRELSASSAASSDVAGAALILLRSLPPTATLTLPSQKKLQTFLMQSRISLKVVSVACRVLERLSADFGRTWQSEVNRLMLASCPELVILGALSCAMKFEEDKSYSSLYWARAVAQNSVRVMDVSNCERVILGDIEYKIAFYARQEEEIERILRSIKSAGRESQVSMQQMLGFGRYEKEYANVGYAGREPAFGNVWDGRSEMGRDTRVNVGGNSATW